MCAVCKIQTEATTHVKLIVSGMTPYQPWTRSGQLLRQLLHELGIDPNDPQLVFLLDWRLVAQRLRTVGWCVYYFRSQYGIDDKTDHNLYVNYGREEGLIFGAYCPRLLEWKLANL